MRRAAVADRRLYLITGASPRVGLLNLIERAVQGGVDMVQLREKNMSDRELLALAIDCVRLCRRLGVPFIVNNRVNVALAANADGVHLGQDDLPVGDARIILGSGAIIGFSTHSPEQIDVAGDVDYIGVGPIHETPTKPGRPAVGAELVRYAADHAAQPFFAIGGLNPTNVAEVVRAGARGVSVLRYISDSQEPNAAARALIAAMDAAQTRTSAADII
ncbi:MAG: thiamine phosphate synthase [Candidatus Eremiobacteraeota bacterium]|nr:thiamine phosphate synthase [Candidatus Eremiobacteraeota bacterium]